MKKPYVYHFYKFYPHKKEEGSTHAYALTEKEWLDLVKLYFDLIAQYLSLGRTYYIPRRLGRLMLQKDYVRRKYGDGIPKPKTDFIPAVATSIVPQERQPAIVWKKHILFRHAGLWRMVISSRTKFSQKPKYKDYKFEDVAPGKVDISNIYMYNDYG